MRLLDAAEHHGPVDAVVPAGHRIGLVVGGTDTANVPVGAPGRVRVDLGGTVLRLPVVGRLREDDAHPYSVGVPSGNRDRITVHWAKDQAGWDVEAILAPLRAPAFQRASQGWRNAYSRRVPSNAAKSACTRPAA